VQPAWGGVPTGSQTGQSQLQVVSLQVQPERGGSPTGSHTGQFHEQLVSFQLQPDRGGGPSGSQTGLQLGVAQRAVSFTQTFRHTPSGSPRRQIFSPTGQIGSVTTVPEEPVLTDCDVWPTEGSFALPHATKQPNTANTEPSAKSFMGATFRRFVSGWLAVSDSVTKRAGRAAERAHERALHG
jgi:hypothetical protein